MALKSKVKKWVKYHNPHKAYIHALMDMCVQQENNPANVFRDIVRKLNFICQQLKSTAASKLNVKIRSKVITFKRHIYTTKGMRVCNMKTIRLRFLKYRLETKHGRTDAL